MGSTPIEAVIFDMDGVLLESESLWRIAEQEASDRLGLGLGMADFDATMGVRMRDIAHQWYARRPWSGETPDEVADQVIGRVAELVAGRPALPGVIEAVTMIRAKGIRLALCSSSDSALIEAVLEALELTEVFEVVHSAENDEYGKPHPMPYLETAKQLGVDPKCCVAIEDSLTGAISAKAAGMRVVAVPEAGLLGDGTLGFANLTLESLEQFDDLALARLAAATTTPAVSRPRFHRAFGVDDLERARWFYVEVLGCKEGRSADTWIDFDLFGHQIVAHQTHSKAEKVAVNQVDGHDVPAEHFGLLLNQPVWRSLVRRLEAHGSDLTWIMKPTTRFAGKPGEQSTLFIADPAGNALEFKAFADDAQVFAR